MRKSIRFFIMSLVILLLPGCTIPRVLTDLPDGEVVENVRLRDGYLRFVDGTYIGGSQWSIGAGIIDLPYEEIVTDLRFDPVEMSQSLPEKFHFTEESVEEVYKGTDPPYQMPMGGYRFSRKGDPGDYVTEYGTVYPTFRIFLKRLTEDEQNGTQKYWPLHQLWPNRTFPWEQQDSDDKYRAEWRSEIGEYEVGLVHKLQYNFVHFPDAEWDYFYGGFYVGDLAVSIESEYGYCTQAEFVEVFLAIFDYLTASEQ